MTMNSNQDEILRTITTAPARRVVALIVVAILGILLIYLGVSIGADLVGQAFLVIVGALCIWLANQMFVATSRTLELTKDELRDSYPTIKTSLPAMVRLSNDKTEILLNKDDFDTIDSLDDLKQAVLKTLKK